MPEFIKKSPEEMALLLAASMLGEVENELNHHYKKSKNESSDGTIET